MKKRTVVLVYEECTREESVHGDHRVYMVDPETEGDITPAEFVSDDHPYNNQDNTCPEKIFTDAGYIYLRRTVAVVA